MDAGISGAAFCHAHSARERTRTLAERRELSGRATVIEAVQVARLKTRLLCLGLRLASPESAALLGRGTGAGPAVGVFLRFLGTIAQVPTRAPFVRSSPFQLDPEGWLREGGEALCRVEAVPRPSFYEEPSPSGTRLAKIVQMHGPDCLGSTVVQACSRKRAGDGCAFCGIDLSLDGGATILEKSPSELAFAARRAREAGARHMVLTSGTGAPVRALAEAARAVRDEGLAVQVQLSFPVDPRDLDAVAFADSIGIHIESLDERVLAHLAPAKAAAGGIEAAFGSIGRAVGVFGRGRVNSFVILGLGERVDPTVRGIERLASLGAYPYLVPLRPIPGTALGAMRPPPAEYVERLCLRAAHAVVAEGLASRHVGAGCGFCPCCSPLPDFEEALRAGPAVAVATGATDRALAREIRERVFVGEQGVFETTDADSLDSTAIPLVARREGEIIGTVRLNETAPGDWLGSRLAVSPEGRRRGAGAALVLRAVDEVERLGGRRFRAHVQAERAGLFDRLGWARKGECIVKGREHVAMEAPLFAASEARPRAEAIAAAARAHPGIARKRGCSILARAFEAEGLVPSLPYPPFAEDAAPIADGDGYLLLATDGIVSGLVREDPYLAGFAAVMANANDIYATGGRPIAMVNVLASADEASLAEIVRGLAAGAAHYGIPMVGGHHHPDAAEPSVSVAILGRARRLIPSHGARPGDWIIAAIDLDGERGCRSWPSWDAASRKDRALLRARLETLPALAEEGLVSAGKDVSNGGLLGTIGMLAEASGVGTRLWLDGLPTPSGFDLAEWLLCFMSLGFVLAAPDQRAADRLGRAGFAAWPIGRATEGGAVEIEIGDERATVWQFPRDRVTGVWNVAGER